MSIVLPPNWCSDGYDSQRHQYMRCLSIKIIEDTPCQCIKRVRASSHDVPHAHQYELPRKNHCSDTALLSFYQDSIKKSFAKMIATTNLSALQAENPALKEVILISIKALNNIYIQFFHQTSTASTDLYHVCKLYDYLVKYQRFQRFTF